MKIDAEALAKSMIRRAGELRFHRIQRVQATSILKAIEKSFGKTSRADLDRADAYAREVLGHARYAPWLYVYSAIAGRFKEGWIPDNYYGRVVVPSLNGGYGRASALKSLQHGMFASQAFPDVAYFANGLFITPDGTAISPDSVARRLFSECDSLVFKVDEGLQGKGIHFFDRNTFDLERIKSLGNGVFQRKLTQHEVLARFSPRSVATLRITTAVSDSGVASVRACYLRLGRDADTHVQSASNVRVAVDRATGELAEHGFLPNWTVVRAHPDSNIRFAGVTIPAFADCLKTALDHHAKVPFVRCVGWDVAVDQEGDVKLMEWNGGHNDIKFSEATQGPCFADLGWERLGRKANSRSRSIASSVPEARRVL